MTNKTYTYDADEIFEDIEGDEENVLMKIPPEILEAQGWKEGDQLKIEWGDQGSITISKVKE
jgi:hypothetical protein